MIGFRHKTDARIIQQQDPNRRIFVPYKLHESAKNDFLKQVGFLGELDTKKTIGFDLKRLRLTKICDSQFLKYYEGVPVNQQDFYLPEYKLPKIAGNFKT